MQGVGELLPNTRGALAAVGEMEPGGEEESAGRKAGTLLLAGPSPAGCVRAWAFKSRPSGVSFYFSHPPEVRAEALATGTASPLDGPGWMTTVCNCQK